jgi:hypothetical protein
MLYTKKREVINKTFIANWEKHSNNEFENSFSQLHDILSKFDACELLSKMYVIQNINFKSDLGYQTVTPLHQNI